MATLSDAIRDKKNDLRMINRLSAKGVSTKVENDKLLKALPDDAEAATYVDVDAIRQELEGKSGLR